jgi:AcrR family transcriptional regulator
MGVLQKVVGIGDRVEGRTESLGPRPAPGFGEDLVGTSPDEMNGLVPREQLVEVVIHMVRTGGLNSLSLRALANAVGMEPQSLYTYFPSKHAVYDRLFADANEELWRRLEQIEVSSDPSELLRTIARLFIIFAAEDHARYELLFLRTVPGFEPSPESYARAVKVFTKARSVLRAAGVNSDADFDLWTAIVAGLASQQLANDPRGDRYVSLVDNAVAMFAAHVFDQRVTNKPER